MLEAVFRHALPPTMHATLLPLDRPSSWFVALAFVVALALASRTLERLTGRSGRPGPGREHVAYLAIVAAGVLGTEVFAPGLVRGPILVGMVCGAWSLVAQGFFGRPVAP
jgi:hypothetical protein